MRYEKKTRSMNFLLELLIVVVFFALACIICIPILVNTSNSNKLINIKNEGLLELGSITEKMRVYRGEPLNEYLEGCAYTRGDTCVISDLENDQLNDYHINVNTTTIEQTAGIIYETEVRLVDNTSDDVLIEFNTRSYMEKQYE